MMKQQLQTACQAYAAGNVGAVEEAAQKLKALPRTPEGIFDLSGKDADEWELAQYAYPVYAAYETACNKQAGYPDLAGQVRVWDSKLKKEPAFAHTAAFLDMLIHTIDNTSPQIYEYYRELVDIFRANVKAAIGEYFEQQGSCKASDGAAEALFRAAVKRACETDVLLAEKYVDFT